MLRKKKEKQSNAIKAGFERKTLQRFSFLGFFSHLKKIILEIQD
jgi:hypothetical protein